MKLYVGVKKQKRGDVTLYDIAHWNEYGTKTAPPRPAFRMGLERTMKSSKKDIQRMLHGIAKAALIKKSKISKKTISDRQRVMFNLIGQKAVKATKEIIHNGETVSNAPSTIKSKGFNHPLKNEGELEKGVEYLID